MRAVAVAVVMSQAGFGGAATSFRICPFKNIMSRILGGSSKDEARMSSFAIEVSELKPITIRANSNTLVLGDEVAHSTEIASGSSLVAALMDHLVAHNIPFVLATHMRSLVDLIEPETRVATNFCHFKVNMDYARKTMHFDRKLQPGVGPNSYGLDVAEFLGIPANICREARQKLYRLEKQPESLIQNTCRYNSSKIMAPICEYPGCTEPVSENDHIYPQEIANANAEFAHIKNHASNFQSLCKAHHLEKSNAENKLKRKLGDTAYVNLSPADYKRRMLQDHNILLK